MRYRKTVITIILLLFALSIVGFGKFFPDSIRFELMADLRLSEGALYQATNAEVKKLENWLNGWNKKQVGIDNFVAYIGIGSPRYY